MFLGQLYTDGDIWTWDNPRYEVFDINDGSEIASIYVSSSTDRLANKIFNPYYIACMNGDNIALAKRVDGTIYRQVFPPNDGAGLDIVVTYQRGDIYVGQENNYFSKVTCSPLGSRDTSSVTITLAWQVRHVEGSYIRDVVAVAADKYGCPYYVTYDGVYRINPIDGSIAWKNVTDIGSDPYDIEVTPDDRVFVAYFSGKEIREFDAKDGTLIAIYTAGYVASVCAVPNQREFPNAWEISTDAKLIEDFELQDLSNYTQLDNGMGLTGVLDYVKSGGVALQGGNSSGVYSLSGLPRYPQAGDTFEFWVYGIGPSWSTLSFSFGFGMQDVNNYYEITALFSTYSMYSSDRRLLEIAKVEAGSRVVLASIDEAIASRDEAWGHWLRHVVEWGADGVITYSVYKEDGTLIQSVTAPADTSWTSGGVRYYSNTGQNSIDEIRIL